MQAQELESSLGGVYSRLAVELQHPLAKRLMKEENAFFKDIEPTITTGLESLSRASDLDRLRAFIGDVVGLADIPPQAALRLKYGGIISSFSAGHGVDTTGIIASEEEVDAEQKRQSTANAQAAGAEEQAKVAAGQP